LLPLLLLLLLWVYWLQCLRIERKVLKEPSLKQKCTKTKKIHETDKKMAVNLKEDKEGKMSKDGK